MGSVARSNDDRWLTLPRSFHLVNPRRSPLVATCSTMSQLAADAVTPALLVCCVHTGSAGRMSSLELDRATAVRAFGAAYFNLIRRGADGSLVLSSDRWRLEEATPELFRFEAEDEAAPTLVLPAPQV